MYTYCMQASCLVGAAVNVTKSIMENCLLVFFSLLTSLICTQSSCPCSDDALCKPLEVVHDKEVFGFMSRDYNWLKYNWTEITTIVVFTHINDTELFKVLCHAHSHQVRLVPHVGSDIMRVKNESAQDEYVKNIMERVEKYYFDGLNIDAEDPVADGSNEQNVLNVMVKKIYTAFKAANKNYQITFDVAWSSNCIDGRCYDYSELGKWTDFFFVMAYDERSQIFEGPCIASANSAYPLNNKGILSYRALGIPSEKLVLGLPWYGYDYPCVSVSTSNVCEIRKKPFRGAFCSDAAGSQKGYSDIMNFLLPLNTTGLLFDSTLVSPYFTYKAADGQMHQVWFDNPHSLRVKYQFAKDQKLRGIGFWNLDLLDYNGSPNEVNDMWNAIQEFLI